MAHTGSDSNLAGPGSTGEEGQDWRWPGCEGKDKAETEMKRGEIDEVGRHRA